MKQTSMKRNSQRGNNHKPCRHAYICRWLRILPACSVCSCTNIPIAKCKVDVKVKLCAARFDCEGVGSWRIKSGHLPWRGLVRSNGLCTSVVSHGVRYVKHPTRFEMKFQGTFESQRRSRSSHHIQSSRAREFVRVHAVPTPSVDDIEVDQHGGGDRTD